MFFKKLFELNAMRRTKCSNCMQFRSRNFQQFPKFSEESQISVTKFPKNQKLQTKFIVAKIQPFRTFWNFLETQNLWISDNFGNAATALCTFSKMLEIFRQKFPNFRNFGISATEICTFKIECWKYFNRNLQIFETGNIATDICALVFAIKIGTFRILCWGKVLCATWSPDFVFGKIISFSKNFILALNFIIFLQNFWKYPFTPIQAQGWGPFWKQS